MPKSSHGLILGHTLHPVTLHAISILAEILDKAKPEGTAAVLVVCEFCWREERYVSVEGHPSLLLDGMKDV